MLDSTAELNLQAVIGSGLPEAVAKLGTQIDETVPPRVMSTDDFLARGVYGSGKERTYVSVVTGNNPSQKDNQTVWVGQWPIQDDPESPQSLTLFRYTPGTELVGVYHFKPAKTFTEALSAGNIIAGKVEDPAQASEIRKVAIKSGLHCLNESHTG